MNIFLYDSKSEVWIFAEFATVVCYDRAHPFHINLNTDETVENRDNWFSESRWNIVDLDGKFSFSGFSAARCIHRLKHSNTIIFEGVFQRGTDWNLFPNYIEYRDM